MKVYYRILDVDTGSGSISFRYFTDINDEISLSSLFDIDGDPIITENGYPQKCRTDLTVSLYDNNNPTEEDIKKIAESSAPITWLRHLDQIKINPNFFTLNVAQQMVGSTHDFIFNTPQIDTPTDFREELITLIESIVSNTVNNIK
jgi:hypothetical protein